MTIAWHSGDGGAGRGDVGRWTACLILVLALHGLGALALLTWRTPIIPLETTPAAVMIDLPPLPAPVIARPDPPKPVKQAEPEPPAPPAPKPAVALPLPEPKLPPRRVEPPRQPEPAPTPPVAAAPPESAAAPPIMAARPAAPPPSALPSYQGLLLAQLERNKRYPREARLLHQEGVATLRFTLDRDGKLLAFNLERSSGHRTLDEEVLAMIQRAAPLPPFPPEMTESRLELVVPVRFSLR
jgi:protein TonB